MSKTFIKGKERNHVAWKLTSRDGKSRVDVPLDGQDGRPLWEPIPSFFFRPGDEHIKGNNNTLICLGRDRSTEDSDEIYINNDLKNDDRSGYSDHMGAGAIDIVVGRGAPFPLRQVQENNPLVLGPLFNTIRPPTLQGYPLEGGGQHPGMAMDAARIYISQMTDIDENFRIRKPLSYIHAMDEDTFDTALLESSGRTPTSGIMVKADKVRVHARQNIKLVTRGPDEIVNSQGNHIMKSNVGIHLVANNGFHISGEEEAPQHPLVLGSNLEAALHSLVSLIEESVRITSNFLEVQDRFNLLLSNHFHYSPPGMSLPDILSSTQGLITGLEVLTKGKLQCVFHDLNIVNFKTRFLSNTSKDYINSRYNTVN
tara:strand:- start:7322 stop:8428 length:1107 start_codon:yes stop_codon:yes gene_type:complete